MQALQQRNGAQPAAAGSPTLAAAASDLKPIERLHLETRAMLRGHLSKIYAMQWCADSRNLVSASQDGCAS